MIDHETIHPLVLAEWENLSKLQEVEATELYNRFVPPLQVFDEGNVETGREIRYILGAEQLFQVLSDVQMITHQIVNRIDADWEEKYGKPDVN